MKASIDGIPFNAFPEKFYRDLYTKVYHHKFLFSIDKFIWTHLKTQIPALFEELDWLPLGSFTRTACAPIAHMFYSNITEHDLDESYLK